MDVIKSTYNDPTCCFTISNFLRKYINDNSLIVCIGTDRCIGDCLGPLVGTLLKHNNFLLPVYGTISEPIHALNIDRNILEIKKTHPTSNIIAVDACIGEKSSIGEIQARDAPIHPGKGVGKYLPNVGNASIIGIVDSNDSDELFANRNIRLNLILNMSKIICDAIIYSYQLSHKK